MRMFLHRLAMMKRLETTRKQPVALSLVTPAASPPSLLQDVRLPIHSSYHLLRFYRKSPWNLGTNQPALKLVMRDFILSDNIYIAFLLSLLEKSPSFRFLETKVKGFKIPEDILGSLSRIEFFWPISHFSISIGGSFWGNFPNGSKSYRLSKRNFLKLSNLTGNEFLLTKILYIQENLLVHIIFRAKMFSMFLRVLPRIQFLRFTFHGTSLVSWQQFYSN